MLTNRIQSLFVPSIEHVFFLVLLFTVLPSPSRVYWSLMKRIISVEGEIPASGAAAVMNSCQVGLPRDTNDGGEGSRTITCACGAQDRMKTFNKIMLGFRPIAPRPTFGGPSAGGLVIYEERAIIFPQQGMNRNYVRVGRNINERTIVGSGEVRNSSVVRPQENRTEEQSWNGGFWQCKCNERLREKKEKQEEEDEHPRIRLKLRRDAGRSRSLGTNRKAGRVEVLATVWYVRETCMYGGEGLGRTNWERKKNLERDTFPGFVSDVLNRVQWVNTVFRKMVDRMEWQHEEEQGQRRKRKVEVRVQIQERIPYKAFTCQMKVQYRLGKEVKKPEIVPCDAWRMNGGGFAWRLDVEAALRLGL